MADLKPIALLVGAGLIVIPDPATTATGLAIVAAAVGTDVLDGEGE